VLDGGSVVAEATGKMLWDVVALRLTAEAANQTALVGRAKDLLGAATIAATITGVLLNDKLVTFDKTPLLGLWTVVTGITLAVLVLLALAALKPRAWSFAPNPNSLYKQLLAGEKSAASTQQDPKTVDAWYHDMAVGYLVPREGQTKNQLEKNAELVDSLAKLVRWETYALGALAIEAFLLAAIVATAKP
jgi:hypothetical protein